MPFLDCRGLVKDYPGKRAVDGVDYTVERGEIVGLLGPNGAGKTTSFRMTCGLVTPTKGQVLLDGTDVTNWPLYRRARMGLGYLPQDDSVFGKLTVAQNLQVVLEYLGIKRSERKQRIHELLDQFGIADRHAQVASTLSGGERRRLEIARCLASRPSLILLDEPFAGVDPVTINSIQNIIVRLREQGISILLTDHREQETFGSDRPGLRHLPGQRGWSAEHQGERGCPTAGPRRSTSDSRIRRKRTSPRDAEGANRRQSQKESVSRTTNTIPMKIMIVRNMRPARERIFEGSS
ncbi:MAG: hypothetical protein Ct9H300mP1_18220 [Planctomycetaceae bacterium]|nr:MAG: hypothetical protein Ct9H300mP1_18220 [Planctomycetaceae bacterium]